MPVDGTGTASVEAVKALPVPGMQKPPRWVRKRFRDRRMAAPEKKKVNKPAGLETRPAWLRQDRRAALWRAVYTRGDRQTSQVYSTTLVQYLYISCYLFRKKPVLSYLLLRLLSQ